MSLSRRLGRQRRVDLDQIDPDAIEVVLQPIAELASGELVAVEALARFNGRSPADALHLAHTQGRGLQIEALCLRLALARRTEIPDGVRLSVNLSPDALSDPKVQEALAGDLNDLIIEITEQAATSPEILQYLCDSLRQRGALIAVDDLSTGYAGLLRLTELRPDIVKLDRSLVSGVQRSTDQAAIIRAVASLAGWIGARLIAEGVETLDEINALAELDVDYVQGWAIARPASILPPIEARAQMACRLARQAVLAHNGIPTVTPGHAANASNMTVAVAASTELGELHSVLAAYAEGLGVDFIGVSGLTDDNHLRELTASDAFADPRLYQLAQFPATSQALRTSYMTEAHVQDPQSDAAERALLIEQGRASVLITPLVHEGRPIGIVEFSHCTHRRWSSRDLHHARTLASHLTLALARLPRQAFESPAPTIPVPRKPIGHAL